jgi:PIN domain nuclease of toxin-antitoxin system
MDLLLDTNAYIWFIENNPALPEHVRLQIISPKVEVWVSIATIWEMAIKYNKIVNGKRKLDLPKPPEIIVRETYVQNNIKVLPIRLRHVIEASKLPKYHHDPFDRAIIAQAIVDKLFIASSDDVIRHYPVTLLW